MKKTKARLGEYWDNLFLKAISPNLKFANFEGEFHEHFGFAQMTVKRVIIPAILIYIVLGLVFDLNIFGPLFISIFIFLYSNFIPDVDFIVKQTDNQSKESLWYEKYSLLFFAPMIIYYAILGKARPIYSIKHRCFHNIKSLIIYSIFLVVIGHIFWNESIKISMFVIFGIAGYAVHLIVDEIIIGSKFVKKNFLKDGKK